MEVSTNGGFGTVGAWLTRAPGEEEWTDPARSGHPGEAPLSCPGWLSPIEWSPVADGSGGNGCARGHERPVILIVDAETESLRRLQGLLRAEFELQTAEGVGEAIRVLRRQPVHVVMTAQRLPEMTGVALLGRVQQEWPDTIGVVLTAYCDVRAVIAASDTCRVFRYLLQPWDAEELEAVLRQACAEYREQQERRRVLSTLRRYHAECLAMVEGLRTGRCGTLNATGQGEAREIAVLGRALLDDLDRALAADGRPG